MKRFFQQLINDLRSSGANTPADPSGRHTIEMAASVILLETAASDEDLSHDELSEITEILRDHFHLTVQEAEEILATAETIRKEAIDLHQFTQTINMLCSAEQKMKLMESIWQVIYADGRLDKHEDYLVHKLARLLHIDHKDFIAAKLKARNETGT